MCCFNMAMRTTHHHTTCTLWCSCFLRLIVWGQRFEGVPGWAIRAAFWQSNAEKRALCSHIDIGVFGEGCFWTGVQWQSRVESFGQDLCLLMDCQEDEPAAFLLSKPSVNKSHLLQQGNLRVWEGRGCSRMTDLSSFLYLWVHTLFKTVCWKRSLK